MKVFTVILTISSAVFSIAAQSSLQTFPRPALTENFLGLEKTACVALDSQTKVCQGLSEETASDAKFIVRRNDETIGEWESESFLGETADFQVFKGDLDADKKDELIIANRNHVSNGMGVNYWTIAILPFPNSQEKVNPLQFQTEDFSIAAFNPRSKDGGFEILATAWQDLPVKKNGSRTALYFVGRWFAYRSGQLEPLAKPILVRRYLKSFERERLKNIDNKNENYLGLNSKTAEKRANEPLSELIIESEIDVTIENIEPIKDKENISRFKINLKTKSGNILSLTNANSAESNSSFDFVGDFTQKRIYPKGYLPTEILKGKSAKLIIYSQSKNGAVSSRGIWLMN